MHLKTSLKFIQITFKYFIQIFYSFMLIIKYITYIMLDHDVSLISLFIITTFKFLVVNY